jgi:hypothetical protein
MRGEKKPCKQLSHVHCAAGTVWLIELGSAGLEATARDEECDEEEAAEADGTEGAEATEGAWGAEDADGAEDAEADAADSCALCWSAEGSTRRRLTGRVEPDALL